jgi:hypothetical protein
MDGRPSTRQNPKLRARSAAMKMISFTFSLIGLILLFSAMTGIILIVVAAIGVLVTRVSGGPLSDLGRWPAIVATGAVFGISATCYFVVMAGFGDPGLTPVSDASITIVAAAGGMLFGWFLWYVNDMAQQKHRLHGAPEKILSVPRLWTFNGVGFTVYGATDHDAVTGSYMTTYYFVSLFIPLFPICRYRVIRSGNVYQFLDRGPLRPSDKGHLAAAAAGIALFLVLYRYH